MKGERFQVSSHRKKIPFHEWAHLVLCICHEHLFVRLWEGRAEGEPLLGDFHCIPLEKRHFETLTSLGPQRLERHGHVALPFLLFLWRRLIEELDSFIYTLCFGNLCSFCVFACFIFQSKDAWVLDDFVIKYHLIQVMGTWSAWMWSQRM